MKKTNKKVIVAMSGGVDSSIAAFLLKKKGFDVKGVFLRLWNSENSLFSEKRARQVANILNIPFQTIDFEKEFKKQVVDYFLSEYKAGRTPNPCVVCNKKIKFGLLLKLKADYIATGHYVRLNKGKILKGKDKTKDQSYFLWQLNQDQLKRVLFPVGNYKKEKIKKIAKKLNLPVANIPESQEICFIQSTIGDFLMRHLKQNPGNIVDLNGNIIGKHQGLHFYTIGQRKGIIANKFTGKPWYVLDKNLKKNELIVTQEQKDLMKKELIAKKVNWIAFKNLDKPISVKVKIRYGFLHKAVPAKIFPLDKKVKVVFKRPQRAVTPGQSAVFYKGNELLGGGIII